MSVQANLTCGNRIWTTSITAAIATRAKMLVDQAPGGLTLPDSASFPAAMPQITRGGQRIIAGTVSSTDTVARDVLLYRGNVLTSQTQTVNAPGTLAVATSSTVTRTTGSFAADGWTVGDALMVFGAAPAAWGLTGAPDYSVNAGTYTLLASVGILALVTGVSALTLTVNGTPLTPESLVGCRLVRVAQVARNTVAIGAGNAAATPASLLLGTANEIDITNLLAADRGLSMGASDVLVVAAQAAISALPAQLNFNASSVLF